MTDKLFDRATYDRAVKIVRDNDRASTSFLQRKMKVGYNVAAAIMGQMEKRGVVTPPSHTGKREVTKPETNHD